jgi:hypothetical protein
MGKVKVEPSKYCMQGTDFTKCQAFEALGILLELRNCREDCTTEICANCSLL